MKAMRCLSKSVWAITVFGYLLLSTCRQSIAQPAEGVPAPSNIGQGGYPRILPDKAVADFKSHGLKVEFASFPGGHEWQVWRKSLHDFASGFSNSRVVSLGVKIPMQRETLSLPIICLSVVDGIGGKCVFYALSRPVPRTVAMAFQPEIASLRKGVER
jgi:hypothetical protein